jgi:dihydroorotate dehydrogenase
MSLRKVQYCNSTKVPLICSLGYTAEDIASLAPKVANFADGFELSTDYISDDPKPMQDAIRAAIHGSGGKPVFVKLSPFRDASKAALAAAAAGVTGIVCVNSYGPTLALDIDRRGKSFMGSKSKYGWMSGPAVKPLAIRTVYDVCKEVSLPVIGVGVITNGRDAIEFLMAGASSVGICTAAIVKGRGVFNDIANEMTEWMEQHGYKSVEELVGLSLKQDAFELKNSPKIDADKCIGCGQCVTSCLYEALKLNDDGVAVSNPNLCFKCGLCYSKCLNSAISLE